MSKTNVVVRNGRGSSYRRAGIVWPTGDSAVTEVTDEQLEELLADPTLSVAEYGDDVALANANARFPSIQHAAAEVTRLEDALKRGEAENIIISAKLREAIERAGGAPDGAAMQAEFEAKLQQVSDELAAKLASAKADFDAQTKALTTSYEQKLVDLGGQLAEAKEQIETLTAPKPQASAAPPAADVPDTAETSSKKSSKK